VTIWPALGKRIEQFMRTVNHVGTLPQRAIESCFDVSALSDKSPLVALSKKAARSPIQRTEKDERQPDRADIDKKVETDADLAFLKPTTISPITVRLAGALADAFWAIRQDPMAFIGAAESGPVPKKKKGRTAAGITVAIFVYALAFSTIYASYSTHHRGRPEPVATPRPEITFLAPPPVMKAAPAAKQADPMISKSQLPAPTRAPAPSTPDLMRTAGPPRAIDQIQSKTEPSSQVSSAAASAPHPPAVESASGIPASGGAVSGAGTGNGAVTNSEGGRGGALGAGVNYNEVFSANSVTARPQILGRPVPGYTEEARRAQIEGAVRLSVVLNANGTVSDIRVARGLGYGLDEKAIEAARQLQFVPAQKDGHTVSVRVFIEFKFSLL
jgi:TonB family protein